MSVLDQIGTQIDTDDVVAALVAANLNWDVTKEPLKHPVTEVIDGNAFATMRSDNQLILKWGVSNGYNIVQNRFAFDIAFEFIRNMECRITSAGEFRGGRRVWLNIATQKKVEIVPGDVIQLKLIMQNAHDASMGQRCMMLAERLVSGTGMVARDWHMMKGFSWRHSASVQQRMRDAAAIFTKMAHNFELTGQMYSMLAHRTMISQEVVSIVESIYPKPEDRGDDDKNLVHRTKVIELYENNSGEGETQIKGTAYGLMNAVANYVDFHEDHRGSPANHAKSVLTGKGLKFKFQALGAIRSVVGI